MSKHEALFSATWYRARAEDVRHSGETVSRYNYFMSIAEAIDRDEAEIVKLRNTLEDVRAYFQESRKELGLPLIEGTIEFHVTSQLAVNKDQL